MIFNMSGGGGAALNFKVMGGTAEPSNPAENTIWIDTDAKITGWLFSSHQPENPAEGMVWIATGSASNAEFNALKKNNITVYPMSAKQYVNGAWVNKTAKSYQNGAWVDWALVLASNSTMLVIPTRFVREGSSNVSLSGNKITWGSGDSACGYEFADVDVTDRNRIYAKVSYTRGSSVGHFKLEVGSAYVNIGSDDTSENNVDLTLDVTNIIGKVDVQFYVQGGSGKGVCTLTIHEMRIE